MSQSVRLDIAAKRHPDPAGGDRLALRDLQLDIAAQEMVCLFGPSGCGKTTLMTIVAGLDSDFEGTVDFDGPRPAIGVVFQNPRLLPWMTVAQNLALVLTEDVDARVDAVLAATGLAAHRDHYPGQLSGGLARRVALARAMVVEPALLLLDEPFASLDQKGADELRRELQTVLQARPTTALFVTHDLREAALLADRVVFLSAAPGTVVTEVRLQGERAARFDEGWLQPALVRLRAAQPA
ncbi:MAG: ATP-binding cassette domain-containing protein [Alphaproteobacteria bacterium]